MRQFNAPSIAAAALATAGAVGGAYYAYQVYKNQAHRLPEEWTEVGTLKELYLYPIKSCGAVLKNTAECTVLGLKDGWLRDRVLMVVDEKYNFVTARVFPELLLVQPSLNGPVLTLKHPDMEDIQLNLAEVAGLDIRKTATVWGISVPVFDCGFDVSNWFSRLLSKSDTKYRMVYYASQTGRTIRADVKSNKLFRKWRKDDTGAFPDEVPYHIINEASVDDLSSRMADKIVSHRNFRPNFVIDGPKAYEEDFWNFVKIGDNIFEVIKPCTRCVLTTIDPETGIRDPNTQPLQFLRTLLSKSDTKYRMVYYASQTGRTIRADVKSNKLFRKWRKDDTGAFPDEVPYHIINEASVDDLSSRMADKIVSHRNFRPNFVIDGPKAYYIKNYIAPVVVMCYLWYRQVEDPEERRAAGTSPRMGLQIALRSGPGSLINKGDKVYVA